MTTSVVRAIKTSQQEAAATDLDSWGARPGAVGEAATSGMSLLARQDLPQVGTTGIWDCTPGRWTVAARPVTEVSFIVAGRGRVTDSDGEVHEISVGDVLVLPAGWSGQWEIVERLRKIYVLAPE